MAGPQALSPHQASFPLTPRAPVLGQAHPRSLLPGSERRGSRPSSTAAPPRPAVNAPQRPRGRGGAHDPMASAPGQGGEVCFGNSRHPATSCSGGPGPRAPSAPRDAGRMQTPPWLGAHTADADTAHTQALQPECARIHYPPAFVRLRWTCGPGRQLPRASRAEALGAPCSYGYWMTTLHPPTAVGGQHVRTHLTDEGSGLEGKARGPPWQMQDSNPGLPGAESRPQQL